MFSLFYLLLCRVVADALKIGKSVDPEYYSAATIYFSDVVGYTGSQSVSDQSISQLVHKHVFNILFTTRQLFCHDRSKLLFFKVIVW